MLAEHVAHGFQLLTTHDQKQEMVLQAHPLSHKEYVTIGDDKKRKVLGTGFIKVNDHFTLNDLLLWTSLDIICFMSLSLLMLIWMCFLVNLVFMFLILLASSFVSFLTLEKFFKPISHLLSLL
jgi:sensor histidine kinase YesM